MQFPVTLMIEDREHWDSERMEIHETAALIAHVDGEIFEVAEVDMSGYQVKNDPGRFLRLVIEKLVP